MRSSISAFEVQLNENTLYSGTSLPSTPINVDTRHLDDGTHFLVTNLTRSNGSTISQSIPFDVENSWRISDEQVPPLVSDWFGTVDRSKTVDASSGWEYATDDTNAFFGDTERRVRSRNSSEYLTWKTPMLQKFSLKIFSSAENLNGILALSVSEDGSTWTEITYETEVKAVSDGGLHWLDVSGFIPTPDQIIPNYFRLTLNEGRIPFRQIQLGRVEFIGLKSIE